MIAIGLRQAAEEDFKPSSATLSISSLVWLICRDSKTPAQTGWRISSNCCTSTTNLQDAISKVFKPLHKIEAIETESLNRSRATNIIVLQITFSQTTVHEINTFLHFWLKLPWSHVRRVLSSLTLPRITGFLRVLQYPPVVTMGPWGVALTGPLGRTAQVADRLSSIDRNTLSYLYLKKIFALISIRVLNISDSIRVRYQSIKYDKYECEQISETSTKLYMKNTSTTHIV